MGASQLNAVGEYAGAIARLDQALQVAGDDASSRARILATRAFYEALSANPTVAQRTLDEALRTLPEDAGLETLLSVETSSAEVALVLLGPGSIESATATISLARSNQFDWMVTALMVLVVPTLGSSGDSNQAIAWADALYGYAASLPHAARELDAEVWQVALRARKRLVDPAPELAETARRTLNTIALWRLQILRLYLSATRGNAEAATEVLVDLESSRAEIFAGFRIASDGFNAFVDAHFGSRSVAEIAPPATPTLLTLSGALAAAEATATSGSQSAAADWLRWFETQLPATVATSVEWPSCRKRVEGLLLLRLGREREAVTRLQEAIACCEQRDDPIQAAIGRVQLAEALLRGSTASMLPATHARSLRQSGADELRGLGVDPIPFAYAASRTFLREEQIPERGGLTPREAQVLGRLAKGLAYKEIGSDLGINPRTVGVHASHCYEKLGVRNRVEAVKLAQELGIV